MSLKWKEHTLIFQAFSFLFNQYFFKEQIITFLEASDAPDGTNTDFSEHRIKNSVVSHSIWKYVRDADKAMHFVSSISRQGKGLCLAPESNAITGRSGNSV